MTILKASGFPGSFTPDRVRRLFEPFGPVRSIASEGTTYYIEIVSRDAAEEAKKLLEGIAFGDEPLHLVIAEGAISAVA